MNEKVDEKIEVLSEFKQGAIIPRAFKWNGRVHKVKKVHLAYQEREGAFLNYYFSAECGGAIYKLRFNNGTLIWFLEEYTLE